MTDNLSVALAEIRERHEVTFDDPAGRGRPDLLLAVKAARDDVPRLLAALDAALKLHSCVPWYAAADGCGHPEPPDDSEEHDDWHDEHPFGSSGIQVCLLEQVDSFCRECTRLTYDTEEPESEDFVSAPCGTRSAVLKALTGKGAADA